MFLLKRDEDDLVGKDAVAMLRELTAGTARRRGWRDALQRADIPINGGCSNIRTLEADSLTPNYEIDWEEMVRLRRLPELLF